MNLCSSSVFHLSYAHKSVWKGLCVCVCLYVWGRGPGAGGIRLAVWGSVCLRRGGRNLRPLWSCGDKRRSTWDSGTCRLGLPAHLLYLLHELLALRAQPAASCHCRAHPVSLVPLAPSVLLSHPLSSDPSILLLHSPLHFPATSLSLGFSLTVLSVACFFVGPSLCPLPSLFFLLRGSEPHTLSFVILPSSLTVAFIPHWTNLTFRSRSWAISTVNALARERWRGRVGFGFLGGAKMPQLSKPGPPQQHLVFSFLIHTFSWLSVWGRSRRRNVPDPLCENNSPWMLMVFSLC